MKAPFTLSSAVEKVLVLLAFLPVVSMVYPETAVAAYSAQNDGNQALVFQVNSKQKPNGQPTEDNIEENPTLKNPCYPAPIDSCNPNESPLHQSNVNAKIAIHGQANSDYSGNQYSKEEVQQLIKSYSELYGVNPETPLCIARLESGYNQFSKNRGGSSASGVFQYLTSTWKHTDEGKAGLSVFDAEANVKAAVKYMAVHKSTKPWTVRGKCPALSFTK